MPRLAEKLLVMVAAAAGQSFCDASPAKALLPLTGPLCQSTAPTVLAWLLNHC